MRVATKRWGEVTIKKQGEMKNKFDKTTSFSILNSNNGYDVFKLKELFTLIVNLTDRYSFKELKFKLEQLDK